MTLQQHKPVLLEEAVNALITDSEGVYIDGTFGRGGHSRAILSRLGERGRLIVVDKDPQAIAEGQRLQASDPRVDVEHRSFAGILDLAQARGIAGSVTGVLLDLGVSSPQLDQAERGFSFLNDGPLDMRMDPTSGISAADWVNSASEQTMTQVFRDYGEERFARRIARAIVAERLVKPFARTRHLAEVIAAANPKWERDKHPATRCFQAIRIEINQELQDLQTALSGAMSALAPGGRLVIISFHSLEDRLVKRFFKTEALGDDFPKGLPVTADQQNPKLILKGKPVRAGEVEVQENVRARSAIMRAAEKL